MPRAASAGRSAASSRTVSSRRAHRYPVSSREWSSRNANRIALRPFTVGPCSASPVHRWFGRVGLEPAERLPAAAPSGRVVSSSRTKWRCRVRSSGAQPACARRIAATCAAVRSGISRLQRRRQVQHLGRGPRRDLRAGRDQRVEPAAAPVPDPPVDRGPRHPHRLPERACVLPLRQGAHQPAPLLGRSTAGRRPPGSAQYRNSPTARARSARTCSSSWPNAINVLLRDS